MKEKRVRSIFLRSISSTSELVGKCATRKPKLGFLWNFWCHSYFPLETAPRSAQFTPLLPLLREIIKAEWCQIVKLNVYVQWNLDLRKILGVTKIFLKSRFFLISNTRKSLITYINNSKLSILFRQSIHDSDWFKTKKKFKKFKLNFGIALELPKSPYFFHFLGKNLS